MQVAIVEDDPIIAKAVSAAVSAAGHQCRWIPDGSVAGKEALIARDLVILDLMLPGEDGLSILKAARAGGVRTPVIVLTARGLVSEKLQAFEAGAEDIITASANSAILAASEGIEFKMVASLSRESSQGFFTKFMVNTRYILQDDLLRFQGQVVTRKMLCEHVWGFDWDGPTNVIEVHINRLRGKVDKGRDASLIQTIRGRGYALATG